MGRTHQNKTPLSPALIDAILNGKNLNDSEGICKIPAFHVDRDFEVQNNAIRKKLNLMEEGKPDRHQRKNPAAPAFKCILDLEHHIVHDRDCACGRDIKKKYLGASKTRPKQGFRRCKRCFLNLLVRQVLKNEQYTKQTAVFLKSIGGTADRLLRLIQRNDVRLQYINSDILQIRVNEDTWQIRKEKGTTLLFHNNYVFRGRQRKLLNSFHEQKVRPSLGFDGYADLMETYKPAFHLDRIIEKEELEMEQAPDNFIQPDNIFQNPTAIRLKKKGLIFIKYIIVDGKECFYKNIFKKRGIWLFVRKKALIRSGDYMVLICLVPKWQRKKVSAAVNEMKRRLFKVKKRDADLCCRGIRNVLERRNVPYSRYL